MNENIEAKPEHLRSEKDKNRLIIEKNRQVLVEQWTKQKLQKLFNRTDLAFLDSSVLEKPGKGGLEITIHITLMIPS